MRDTKWSPEIIGDLFFDAQDYQGLEYWYEDIMQMIKEIPKSPEK
jgi:hypothetical protein